jgi:L-threonine kinase
VDLVSPLPAGRGYGTSTADIGAVLFAAARAQGIDLSGESASRLAVAIEPTDSTLFGGLTLFDHRQGRFFQPLGAAPMLKVILLDPGGFVDSEEFNWPDPHPALARLAREHRQAFDLLQSGVAARDLDAIGAAATQSARLHQAVLFNPLLEAAAGLARELGALGICRAHSGTILGLLFDPAACDDTAITHWLSERIPSGVKIISTRLVDGGPRSSRMHVAFEMEEAR